MSEVNVLSRVQSIIVNPTTRSVAVINMGPQGPGGIQGPPGADGADGAPGATGPPGPGVAVGGAAGQMLTKIDATNFNTQWVTPVTNLDSITNVNAPTAVDGQALVYDNASGMWVPRTIASGGGLPPGGVIYNLLVKASSADGDAVWSSVPQVASLTTDALAIRDAVGVGYPRLTFGFGDGNNGTNPNPYDYTWQLLNDKLQLFSSRSTAKQLASFQRVSTTKTEFALGDWVWQQDEADNYLRLFYGTDRASAEMTVGTDGTLFLTGGANIPGALKSTWYTESPYYQAASGTPLVVRSSSYIGLQGYGAFGSPNVGMNVGNQYGVGDGPTVSVFANPNGNQYYQRQLTLNKIGGAGECGMGFINNVTGNIGCFQLHNDGAPYIGFLNSANSAYIKSYASAFTVNSSRRFKAELERFGAECRYAALDIIRQVVPVRYRDLQHEMAAEVLAPYPDGTPRKPVAVEPNYRFGLVAEEVEEAAPELVSHTPDHGPGIDLSGLIGVLWQAVRELTSKLNSVERELADIRGYPQ